MAFTWGRRIKTEEKGQLLPLYAAAMSLALLMLAIMVDLGFVLMYRLELQQIAAGAAAAGSEYYDREGFRTGYQVVLDRTAAEAAARLQVQEGLKAIPDATFEVQAEERDVLVTVNRSYRPWWWPVGQVTITAAERAAPLGVR